MQLRRHSKKLQAAWLVCICRRLWRHGNSTQFVDEIRWHRGLTHTVPGWPVTVKPPTRTVFPDSCQIPRHIQVFQKAVTLKSITSVLYRSVNLLRGSAWPLPLRGQSGRRYWWFLSSAPPPPTDLHRSSSAVSHLDVRTIPHRQLQLFKATDS